jgi:hypothetical protein
VEEIMEHHRRERRSTSVRVLIFTRPAASGIGRVLNISSSGAYMETQLPLRLLSLIYLEPSDQSSAHGTSGRIAATVVRRDTIGVGLEWCEFAAEATEVYARLAAGPNDFHDAAQLPLLAMADALPSSRSLSGSLALRGLCRVEFLD